jgi:hypothetical protein
MSSAKPMSWFRLYSEAIDDEKLRLLAFEDRWHFVALLCCKSKGLLDSADSHDLKTRKVALKLGLSTRELDEVARRLAEVGLIDRETLQPLAWDERQYQSDASTDRVRKFRERQKQTGNAVKRPGNVSVTVQETETETESPLPPTGGDGDPPVGSTQQPAFPPLADLVESLTPAEPAAPIAVATAALDVPAQVAVAAAPATPAALAAVQPTMLGLVCRAMKAAGISDPSPGNPRLRALIAAGADVDEFIAAASKAASKRCGFAYALTIVENDRLAAATMAPKLHQGRLPGSAAAADEGYSNLLRGAI